MSDGQSITTTKPRYPMAAAIGEGLRSAYKWASEDPLGGSSTPPLKVAADLIGVPALAATAERIGYGDRLTTGSGQTLQVRPDTIEAAGVVAPIVAKTIPMAAAGGRTAVKTLGPKAAEMAEDFLHKTGGLQYATMKHSSPHRFDKFSSEHIGKGEGNQSYGQGLYFTDSDSVHAYYNKQFGKRLKQPVTLDGNPVDLNSRIDNVIPIGEIDPASVAGGFKSHGDIEKDVIDLVAYNRSYADPVAAARKFNNKTIRDIKQSLEDWDQGRVTIWRDNWTKEQDIEQLRQRLTNAENMRDWLNSNKGRFKTIRTEPTAYEVDFTDDKYNKMLDWSKKIKDQPEHIRKIAKDLFPDFPATAHDKQLGATLDDISGENLYRLLSAKMDADMRPGEKFANGSKASDLEASRYLVELGVPGHSYPAAGGKARGRNYVIYPGSEDDIQIMRTQAIERMARNKKP